MTFKKIMWKNICYNGNKYLSYLFVNSFVVTALFLFGSLLFNEKLIKNANVKTASLYIDVAAVAMILFSVVFVTYTGVYFVKSRGKEFSVYLTLGMSNHDLLKMAQLEIAAIVFGSVFCGLVSGLACSKIFYALLAKVLGLTETIYQITWESIALTLSVFLLVMLFNMGFTALFLSRLSIAQMKTTESTKGKDRGRPILGIVGFVLFLFCMWFFHALLTGYSFLRDIARNYGEVLLIMTTLVLLTSLYVTIALLVKGLQRIFKRFPLIYNRYILTFSDLSHRFFSYKTTLYMVSVLIAFSVAFMGLGMGAFGKTVTVEKADEAFPYEFMIENVGSINSITGDEIQRIVTENGGEISQLHILPFLIDMNYRNLPEYFLNYRVDSILVSESNFNAITGESISLTQEEMLLVYTDEKSSERPMDFDSVITVEPWREGIQRGDDFRAKEPNEPDMDTFIQGLDVPYLVYMKENTQVKYLPYLNKYGDFEFSGRLTNVVDDETYESILSLTETQENRLYLFDLKEGDGQAIYEALLDVLREKNGDPELWKDGAGPVGVKDSTESLRPIYREERRETALQICSFLLFAMVFLGLLFLLSSSVVLYYKISADKSEELDRAALLMRIGVTFREYKKDLALRLGILFFSPLLFGGAFGLFLINEVISVSAAAYAGYLMKRVFLVFTVFVLWNFLMYSSLRRKIMREILL